MIAADVELGDYLVAFEAFSQSLATSSPQVVTLQR
jgi:hypothetical protein